MSTPVVTDKWAGNFDCSVCRRKRLVGAEFSKKALERHRKTGSSLTCKKCTAAQEDKERLAAAAKKANLGTNETTATELAKCASCTKMLSTSLFNRNQLSKKEKARCRKCVEDAVHKEESSRKKSKEDEVEEIRKKIKAMEVKGNVQERLKYESQLSALEAEHVTGLKPINMGRGGGRGSWRTRGRGRGRGGGGGRSSGGKK